MILRRTLLLTLSVALLSVVTARAQDIGHEVPLDTLTKYGVYDADLLPPSFHAERRGRVLVKMKPGSVAVLTAAPASTRANDIEYLYHQDADLYYLTGCTEPGSALVLSKEPMTLADGSQTNEILFVRKRDPQRETWTGKRLGVDGALNVLRVHTAMIADSLSSVMTRVLPSRHILYYRPRLDAETDPLTDTAILTQQVLRGILTTRFPSLEIDQNLHRSIAELREVKLEPELRLMRKAIAISNEAHNDVMREVRPGWHEYEIQALAEYIFGKNGAEYTAYPCIVGSGPNSTVLHYETNRRLTRPADFIEMDMGAEYHGYSADVTRSFPVSGKFTPEQRAIYGIVLEAQDSGIRECTAGAPFWSAHRAATRQIIKGLFRLGIIHDTAEYTKYFMHGTSHYLGLDVHDAGTGGKLKPGVVMTVEPGIYVAEGSPCDSKWWNIGCRIEDDILVTPQGPVNLSAASPRTIPEIEQLMSQAHLTNSEVQPKRRLIH